MDGSSFIAQELWDWMNWFAIHFGYFGVFLISFIGALSILFPIPYTLVIYALGASSSLNISLLALTSGLGSAVGEVSGYLLGYYGRRVISEERKRKIDYMMKIFSRYGAVAVFLFALTPLPDDLIFIPLGIARYKFVRAFVPCFLGKLLMSYILAYSGRQSYELIKMIFGEVGCLGVILSILVLLAILIAILKIDWEKVFEKYVAKAEKG